MTYIVTRQYGQYGRDYLLEWDIIWGPMWTGSVKQARRFSDLDKANYAAVTAIKCMTPVPWTVPDLGRSIVMVDGA